MGNRVGFIERVKIALVWLTAPSRRHICIASCEFCGSTNILAYNKIFSTNKEKAVYEAEYICLRCKAHCEATQKWSSAGGGSNGG